MATATTMFPHKFTPPPTRGTPPRHLWPSSVRHDVSEIRRRAQAVRRLVRIEANPPVITPDKPSLLDTHPALWSNVSTPIQFRTSISPLPRGLDALGLLTREKLTQTVITFLPRPYKPASRGFERRLDSFSNMLVASAA